MTGKLWRKASFSTTNGACVEVAWPPVIRDSKAPESGRLVLTPAAFDALLELVRR
jgi:hypothetical protein